MRYLENLKTGNPKSCVCLAMNEIGQQKGTGKSDWQR